MKFLPKKIGIALSVVLLLLFLLCIGQHYLSPFIRSGVYITAGNVSEEELYTGNDVKQAEVE